MISKQRKRGCLGFLKRPRGFKLFSEISEDPGGFWGNGGGTVGVPTDFLAILEDYQVREMIHQYKELGRFL